MIPSRSKRIFVYKMTCDNNGAPCIYQSLLSLAICKPMIRKSAEKGDLIFGFGGKEFGQKLIYAAEVTETLNNYFDDNNFRNRPDCVYEKTGTEYHYIKGREHHSQEHLEHDLGKKGVYERNRVIISRNFVYFGISAIDIAHKDQKYVRIKNLVDSMGQGHRVKHGIELYNDLLTLFNNLITGSYPKNKYFQPHDKDPRKVCSLREDDHHFEFSSEE
jgi:hypothetical protein